MSIYKHDLSYLLCFCVAAIQLPLTAHNPHQNAYQHNIGFRRPVVKLKCRIIVNKTGAAICTGVNAIGTMLHVPPKGIETCVNHRANTQSGICEVGQLYAGVPLKMLLLQGSQSGLCKSHESVPRSALPGVICQTCACASAQQWECEIVEAYLGHMSCSFREQLTIYG